jgi:hypothetical protein
MLENHNPIEPVVSQSSTAAKYHMIAAPHVANEPPAEAQV